METVGDMLLEYEALKVEGAQDMPKACSIYWAGGIRHEVFAPGAFEAWQARALARVTRTRELRVKLGLAKLGGLW